MSSPAPSLSILGVHHVAIIASDYDASKHFYAQILGFPIVHEAYRAERKSYKLDLRTPDGTCIELFSFPNPPPRVNQPEACGLRHLAFKVADIQQSIQYLAAHHVPCEPVRVDEFTHKKFTFLKDPDGLPIELYEAN